MQVELSVIIPIFNVKKYLNSAIDSVLNQDFEHYEVILVDDGSNDGCYEICEYYRSSSKVKIIHKKNGGLVSARKAGVENATGEFICFLDGDDWVEPDYYRKQLDLIKSSNADIVCCAYLADDTKNVVLMKNNIKTGIYNANELNDIKRKLLCNDGKYYSYGVIPTVWSKIFKKEKLEKWLYEIPEEITIGEDVCCTIPYIFDSERVCIDNNIVGYHYRIVTGSMSRSFPDGRIGEIKELLIYMMHILKRFNQIDNISYQYNMYASFAIKHIVKGTSMEKKYRELKDFSEDTFIHRCLEEIVRYTKLPIVYKTLFSFLYRGNSFMAITYYRMVNMFRK